MFGGLFPFNTEDDPSRGKTYHSISLTPFFVSAGLLCPDCSLSPRLLPLSSLSLTHTDTISVGGGSGLHKERLSHPVASSITLFLFSMLALSFPPRVSMTLCLLTFSFPFFVASLSLSVVLLFLFALCDSFSHGALPHELSTIWVCCCRSCCVKVQRRNL